MQTDYDSPQDVKSGEATTKAPSPFATSAEMGAPIPPTDYLPMHYVESERFEALSTLIRIRMRLFSFAAVLSFILFMLQTIDPLIQSIPMSYPIKYVVFLVLLGLISISFSVALGTILIQYRYELTTWS